MSKIKNQIQFKFINNITACDCDGGKNSSRVINTRKKRGRITACEYFNNMVINCF